MAHNGTHYERAFEAYLQQRKLPYVVVDQVRKAAFGGVRIKSFDFIVYPPRTSRLLLDVKGRKLRSGPLQRGRIGPSWTTAEDIDGLTCWEKVFGSEYRSVFVFAYWLFDALLMESVGHCFRYQDRNYAFFAVPLGSYKLLMKSRSPRWNTVYVRAGAFKQLAQPFDLFIRNE